MGSSLKNITLNILEDNPKSLSPPKSLTDQFQLTVGPKKKKMCPYDLLDSFHRQEGPLSDQSLLSINERTPFSSLWLNLLTVIAKVETSLR